MTIVKWIDHRRTHVKLGKGKRSIQEIAISEFKAKCLALLEEVDKTKVSLRVTRRGRPIAEVIPASPNMEERNWLGSMADSMQITGDVVSPVIEIQEIEALKHWNCFLTPTFGSGVWLNLADSRGACNTK
jgi:prevent-host-death family protein